MMTKQASCGTLATHQISGTVGEVMLTESVSISNLVSKHDLYRNSVIYVIL